MKVISNRYCIHKLKRPVLTSKHLLQTGFPNYTVPKEFDFPRNLNYFSDSVLYYAMSSFRMLSDVCKREITRTPSEKNSESGSVTRFVDIFYETNPPEPLRNSQKGFAERFVFAEIFGN